jgi:hypothetical protein
MHKPKLMIRVLIYSTVPGKPNLMNRAQAFFNFAKIKLNLSNCEAFKVNEKRAKDAEYDLIKILAQTIQY